MADSVGRVTLDDLSADRRKLAWLLADQMNRPGTALEQTLWTIWSEVLGRRDFGIRHHYLELGGDSIQAIQIVARARREGIALEPRHLFESGTIAQIANALESQEAPRSEAPVVTDDRVVLTPMQQWFIEQRFAEPSHWNQAFLLRVAPVLRREVFCEALRAVCLRHDAFRMRLAEGRAFVDPSSADRSLRFDVYQSTSTAAIDSIAATLNASLRLETGPVIAAAWCEPDESSQAPLVAVVVNHFISDGISLRILLDDLADACGEIAIGRIPRTTARSARASVWAAALTATTRKTDPRPVLDYLDRCSQSTFVLPIDVESAANLEADAVTKQWTLPAAATARLIEIGSTQWRSALHEILLAAFARVLAEAAGTESVFLELEGHGRADVGVDVSQTIGWFTSVFPVALRVDRDATPGEAARDVRGWLRGVPMNGVACGALTYLHDDDAVRRRVAAMPRAQVLFNYLGQFQTGGHERWFSVEAPTCGPLYDGRNHRPHLLQCAAAVVAGALHVYWSYNANIHHAVTIERWIAAFAQELARFGAPPSEDDRRLRPQDFPDADLTEADLDQLFGGSR